MIDFQNELEPTIHTYSRGARLLSDAAREFGIGTSDDQTDHWQLVFTAMHELDSILDSNKSYVERSAEYDRMISVIMGDAEHTCSGCYACHLNAYIAHIPSERQDLFRVNAEQIKLVGEDRRSSKTVSQLGRLSVSEGKMSAELLELVDDTEQSKAFNRWLGNVGVLGALIDTAIDLPSDYETGLTQVQPALRNRIMLATMGLPYAAKVARHMNASMARSFTRALFVVGKDRGKDIVRQIT